MPKPTTSAALRASIADLEGKLPSLVQAVKNAESAVADAYADGSDPSKALDQLARARDAHTGAIRALVELDARLYETALAEYNAASKKIQDDAETAFLKLEREIKAIFKKQIEPLLAPIGVPATKSAEFVELVAGAAWETINASTSEAVFALGPAPSKPRPRGQDGYTQTVAELDAAYLRNRGPNPSQQQPSGAPLGELEAAVRRQATVF